MKIKIYNNDIHRSQVIKLWRSVFQYKETRNNPELSINRKLMAKDNLFFVALEDDEVIGTIMAGYDGHRGWIYSLAVIPERRKLGIGSKLLEYTENELKKLGCVKINLQIVKINKVIKRFYLKNGYRVDERISMGKDIIENQL